MNFENKTDMVMLSKAISFAAEKHSLQRRKGSDTPYINHPLELIEILCYNGIFNTEILVSAVLHDVIEDTEGTYEEIETLFGKEIADIVNDCSDDKEEVKHLRKLSQIQKTKYKSKKALYVKIADKISNCRGLLDTQIKWEEKRIIGYIIWAKTVVDTIQDINTNLYNDFLNTYKTLQNKYQWKEEDTNKILGEYMNLIQNLTMEK